MTFIAVFLLNNKKGQSYQASFLWSTCPLFRIRWSSFYGLILFPLLWFPRLCKSVVSPYGHSEMPTTTIYPYFIWISIILHHYDQFVSNYEFHCDRNFFFSVIPNYSITHTVSVYRQARNTPCYQQDFTTELLARAKKATYKGLNLLDWTFINVVCEVTFQCQWSVLS